MFFFPFFNSQAQNIFASGYYIYTVVDATNHKVSVQVNPQYKTTYGRYLGYGLPDYHPMGDENLMAIPAVFTPAGSGVEYTVVSIADSGFVGCNSLERIVLPSTITHIGNNAFRFCTALESVYMNGIGVPEVHNGYTFDYHDVPSMVETIGDYAFYGCSALSEVQFPTSLKRIGKQAFQGVALPTVSLPENVRTLDIGTFQYCYSLQSVTLNSGLDTIGNNAFFACRSLEAVSIPASVKYLGSSAFRACTALAYVNMNGGNLNNTVIKNYTFAETGITSFLLPSPITEIQLGAFQGCTALADFQFVSTNNLTIIGNSAFKGCTSLQNNTHQEQQMRHWFKLPTSVTTIGDSAFKDCTSLTWMHNPGEEATYFHNLTKIGAYAFAGSTLSNFSLQYNTTQVCKIGRAAFYNCEKLGDINIANVQIIEDSTFMNCTNENFRLSSNNKVKSIRRWAFKNTSLTSIDLSNWTLLDTIGYDAFHSNAKLTTVVLPSNLKHIENGAFAMDTALTTINIPEGITRIGSYVFYMDKNLKRITLPTSIRGIGNSAFRASGLQHISIPNGVRKIEPLAFYECKNLVSVLLRPNINTIDSLAFGGCTRLAVINCLAGTPPVFDSVASRSSFRSITLEDVTCIVPAVSLSRYKTTGWGRMLLESYQEEDELQFLAGEWNFIAGTGKQTGFLNFNNVSAPNDAALSFPVYTSTQQGEMTTTDYRNLDYVALDYDYSTNGWKNSGMHRTHNMTEGAGYLVWMYTSNAKGTEVTSNGAITRLSNYLKTEGNVSYTTAPNTGQQALPNINSGYWYSFGNPFNKSVSISTALSAINFNAQGKVVYVYDNNGWVGKIYGELLPGQGFMVGTAIANQPLTFAMDYPSNNYFPANNIASNIENEGIKFSLTANGLTSNLYAKQMSEAQDGFDINDAYILFSLNEEQIEPYFVVDNNAVKYNRYNSDNYSCKINIHANNSAQASMSVSDVPAGTTVSIVDLATNEETVLEDNAFEFDVFEGENSDRYLIKIIKNGASSLNQVGNTEANISIWNNNKEIFVKGENLQRVEIYNTLGQMVYQKEVSGDAYNFTFDNEGAYVIKATAGCSYGQSHDNNCTKTQKIIIK